MKSVFLFICSLLVAVGALPAAPGPRCSRSAV